MFTIHAFHPVDDNGAFISQPIHGYCYETAALAVCMARRALAQTDDLVVLTCATDECSATSIAWASRRAGVDTVEVMPPIRWWDDADSLRAAQEAADALPLPAFEDIPF
jgi:hypothetical protein